MAAAVLDKAAGGGESVERLLQRRPLLAASPELASEMFEVRAPARLAADMLEQCVGLHRFTIPMRREPAVWKV
jgi:hypothetical protein